MTDREHQADVLLVIYVHSRPGVLAKIASMFYRRGLNIRTLTVGDGREPELAKITMRVEGPRPELERLVPALANLIDVLTVDMKALVEARAHELCLVRVATCNREGRDRLLVAAAPFQPIVVDVSAKTLVLEVAGAPASIELFLETMAQFGIVDVSRTGVTSLPGEAPPSLASASGTDRMRELDRPV
jgi:acetolactate synthase I/III small subunit